MKVLLNRIKAFILFFYLFLSCSLHLSIEEISESSIDSKISKTPFYILLAYTPWCKKCKGIKPAFEKAVRSVFYGKNGQNLLLNLQTSSSELIDLLLLKNESLINLEDSLDKQISFGMINLDKNHKIHTRLNIGNVPEVLIFHREAQIVTQLFEWGEGNYFQRVIEEFLKKVFSKNVKMISDSNVISNVDNFFALFCSKISKTLFNIFDLLKEKDVKKMNSKINDLRNSLNQNDKKELSKMQAIANAFRFTDHSVLEIESLYFTQNTESCLKRGIEPNQLVKHISGDSLIFKGEHTFQKLTNFFSSSGTKELSEFDVNQLEKIVRFKRPLIIYILMEKRDTSTHPNANNWYSNFPSYLDFKKFAESSSEFENGDILVTRFEARGSDLAAAHFLDPEGIYEENKKKNLLEFKYSEKFLILHMEFDEKDLHKYVFTSTYGDIMTKDNFAEFLHLVDQGDHGKHLKTEELDPLDEQFSFIKALNTKTFKPFLVNDCCFKAVLFYGGKDDHSKLILDLFEKAIIRDMERLHSMTNLDQFGIYFLNQLLDLIYS